MKRLFLNSLVMASIMTFAGQASGERQNPLLQPWVDNHGAVPFDKITPADYREAIIEGMRMHNDEIRAITNAKSTPTFENTIVALDRSGSTLTLANLALQNVEHASGDEELMMLTAEVTPLITTHMNDIMLNRDLFDRVKFVYDHRNEDTSLTPEDLRLIEITYDNFLQSGANLDEKSREKFRKLSAELSELNLRFAQNVANEMKQPDRRLWLTIDRLEGLPQSAILAAREAAKETLIAEKGADDESLYMFTVYQPSYSPIMKYAKDRDVRRQMYYLYNTRNTSGQYDNTALLKDIANVRLEIAKLMGKDNFAEYQLQNTMAGNPETVMEFLNNLKDAYTEPMKKELAELTEYARASEGADFEIKPWDYSYWADKLKNERYAFNDEDMKPYFELNRTIDGVFGLATKLYGYKFKENKNIPGYHPDVRVYEVYAPEGELLGLLYADFFYRAGKSPGAWMTEYRGEYKEDDGTRVIPLISIVCNFSKPVGNDPVLLTPYEVETFLHEFGHALHGLSAESKYASISGTNVYHDFVELFSQFNENFLTQKKYLDGFARHYKTGKKMPKDLVERFIRAGQFGAAYACMRQLNFGMLDMAYHMQDEPMRATADIAAFENAALEPVKVFDAVEDCIISPQFAHIFSGGYAAGYYGYKWAEELDADAFEAFLETDIFDKNTAKKFRKMLQSGGSVDPMQLYIEFRGKKPTVDAMMRRDGIIK